MWYLYNMEDRIAAMKYNDTLYYFRRNYFGDVTGVFELAAAGAYILCAEYSYDSWGNCRVYNKDGIDITDTSPYHIGNINPFRYRGYYYDRETSLYYLNSRYYDPETGRFINADEIDIALMQSEMINGLNLYSYCMNNPIAYSDPSGHSILLTLFIAGLIGAGVSGLLNVFQQAAAGNESFDWKQFGRSLAGGFVAGTISAIPIGGFTIGAYLLTGFIGGFASVTGGLVSGSVDITNWESIAKAFIIGAFAGIVAKRVAHLRINRTVDKIMNIRNSGDRSIAINNYMIKKGVKPIEMGHNNFGGWSRNIFKDMSNDFFRDVVIDTTQRSAFLYSTLISSFISGW